MKLIHCADLHLDSRLNTHLSGRALRDRKNELLNNFERLSEEAAQKKVKAILIAGDLFDRDEVSETVSLFVLSVIREHPDIGYYYLRGNHDTGKEMENREIPDNLHLFTDSWGAYELGPGIMLYGRELSRYSALSLSDGLDPKPEDLNIVMLHAETAGGKNDGSGIAADLKLLQHKNIDYLALGHIHKYGEGILDRRGVYVYPGCLEGRGFDESGPHGYVLLDISENGRLTREFVPFAKRLLYREEVSLTGCETTAEMLERVRSRIREAGISREDLIRIELTGELDARCEKDLSFLETVLGSEFFAVKIADRTVYTVDPEDYRYDESLTGEFVRQVLADPEIGEEEKMNVIRYGFQALKNELKN